MRRRMKSGSQVRITSSGVAFFLLLAYVVSLLVYLAVLAHSRLPSPISLVASLGPSPYGVSLGPVSLGYLSIVLVALLGVASWPRKLRDRHLPSRSVAASAVLVGMLIGSVFSIASSVPVVHTAQDSEQGFTLAVDYGATTVSLGQNFTAQYVLTDNSYSLTTPSYFFGGQFSMVFNNSAGKQVVAFRSHIDFSTPNGPQYVQLQPGEVWRATLGWNGTVYPSNGTSYAVPPGSYKLISYAVIQDGNASLYVFLHPSDISVTFT